MLTPERWQQAKEVLARALETAPDARPDYLNRTCVDDAALRGEIERLIEAHEAAGAEFLDHSQIAAEVAESFSARMNNRIGRRVGPYQIVEEIGIGGMGEVYRAIRIDDQYRKQVAIKLVRIAQDSAFFIDRFMNERQVLASLEHANIARLLDGGTTEDGVPYLVMELIEGVPIDEYSDGHKLTTTERLKLFCQVCQAVQYAHRHLIIHRDLKPGNILVTSDGASKLLDFGIAKIADPAASSSRLEPTISIFRMLTPGYASPEQIKGETITTASDVYSLGVLLYELLTGCRPYPNVGRTPHDIARAVCEVIPLNPSTAVLRAEKSASEEESPKTPESVSATRDGSPQKLHRRLKGDLDNIVMMALRKEPQRRYQSVEQFENDIQLHLLNLPVLVTKDTFRYRTSKFIFRHKGSVLAAVLLMIAILGGIVGILHEARIARVERTRAERRFNDVRKLANSLIFELHDSIQELPGATSARRLLVTRALEYLDGLSQEAGGDVNLQRELAAGYERLGDVQGRNTMANIGDGAGALVNYRKALAIRQSIASNSTHANADLAALALDFERIGSILESQGDFKGALEDLRKDLTLEEQIGAKEKDPEAQELLAGSYFSMARHQAEMGDNQGALDSFNRSIAIREAITGDAPDHYKRVQTTLAGSYGYMSEVLSRQGDLDGAIAAQGKAGRIMKKLSDADPTNAAYRQYINESRFWAAIYLQKKGDFTNALINYKQARQEFQTLSAADPQEVRAKRYVGLCDRNIGVVRADMGEYEGAFRDIQQAASVFETISAVRRADRLSTLPDLAKTYSALGVAYSQAAAQPGLSKATRIRWWQSARAAFQKSLDIWLQDKQLGAVPKVVAEELAGVAAQLSNCNAVLRRTP
jgi:eukaryotic-like serine/threonine-protein kinase